MDLTEFKTEWTQLREKVVEALGELPETRLSRPVPDKDGWTVRHSLTYLAGLDAQVKSIISISDLSAFESRRLRGEAMFEAQYLRLRDLTPFLSESADTALSSLSEGEATEFLEQADEATRLLSEARDILITIEESAE
mgnify:CR=1 FL=1